MLLWNKSNPGIYSDETHHAQEVESNHRGSFSTVEAAWQNTFELCSYATTVVFPRPDEFQWPVLMSCIAVVAAEGVYATFVRRRRGHLVHFLKCMDPIEKMSEPCEPTYVELSQLTDDLRDS